MEIAALRAIEQDIRQLRDGIVSLQKQMNMVIEWIKLTMEKERHDDSR